MLRLAIQKCSYAQVVHIHSTNVARRNSVDYCLAGQTPPRVGVRPARLLYGLRGGMGWACKR